jgi:hypothetical protein
MPKSPSDQSPIAERIRLILSKTVENGATEEEAATALSIAAKLMAKHNLSRAQVETGSSAERSYSKEKVHEADRCPLNFVFSTRVVEVVCEVHCCIIQTISGFWQNWRVEVFGDQENVEAASSLLTYLAGVYRDLWTAHKARTWRDELSEAGYYEGLRAGLLVRLEREKAEREAELRRKDQKAAGKGSGEPGTALARSMYEVERLNEAFRVEYPEVQDLKVPADQKSFEAGTRDSQKISLRRQVGGV